MTFTYNNLMRRKCSLLTARILSLALSSLMLGILIYTLVTDGSPFRRDVFTPTITCAYIALQLFRLSSQDSIYLVLFSNSNRQVCAPSV
ncbi:hypothetical protein T459_12525 [Capsicum annuum]|uniref:Uncharacterized protein n=1 Tax=Capsicum annuum TaxID=4072 RepID=A0A2G2ZQ25_CAPAN|nr:hypothetical protein T459_12525 [Capsicum annuum]